MNIDRCVCTGLTFAEVCARARAAGWDLEGIRREVGAGAHCGLCRPYLRRALATGQVRFDRILTDESADG